jgi:hypothetical protein
VGNAAILCAYGWNLHYRTFAALINGPVSTDRTSGWSSDVPGARGPRRGDPAVAPLHAGEGRFRGWHPARPSARPATAEMRAA